MIKKLSVRNFQSIEEADIDLSEGINTFIGESNGGKTALASRAIKILLFNSLFPERMITHGKTVCSIRAEIVNPANNEIVIIERHKNSKTSYFVLNDLKLEKSGSTTGAALLKEHFGIEFSNINMQEQHSQHYFITMSPTEAGIELMKFFDLSEQNVVKEKVAKLQRDNKVVLQSIFDKMNDLSNKIYSSASIKSDIKMCIEYLEGVEGEQKKVEDLKNALESFNQNNMSINDLINRKEKIEVLYNSFAEISARIDISSALLSELENMQGNNKYANINKEAIDAYATTIRNCISRYEKESSLISLLQSYWSTLSEFSSLSKEQAELKQQTHGMVCPTCNQILP